MHEITLSQRALEIIEQQAQQAGARRVSGVWLKVGAFSCVEASALTFCFELVCRGTLAEGCELHIAEQQAECWCDVLPGQYVQLILSTCGAARSVRADGLQIVADDGLQIQRIEVIPA
ncbi:hydrogenase nickel incorporation protein [Raoultella terrigena]|uniref:Hydrogenase nickel incorporation protein n=1 Tax=Raoultella terrigena TaxID=577 RepID=A0A4U9D204_RAOTE|nr:hydrogenase nickel incorporation protein [Raoultella terrigena]